ncbi:hypothetical protein QWJ26_15275 [Streptomyces sp. CSDS2]|uniref:hypothetical protein n=1 Tax=Streptomyces sp. CSDS2 TaxID=3055051 RepID=UPI0025AF0C74|nr:hypothetical protein [Streptomyces sp. CSDS2]MDN3261152.1 hypothetical protein [Streptomyces sp. CSDS2]
MSDDERILALFHALDQLPGPRHLEFPDTFDHAAAKARAIRLRNRLSSDLGHPCRLEDQIQDASYYFGVSVPQQATQAGIPLGVRLSNYGDLAVVTTPLSDSHEDLDHAVREGVVSVAERDRIVPALSALGYTLVPQRLLHRRYTGVTWLAQDGLTYAGYGPHQGLATWWTRFFEHL